MDTHIDEYDVAEAIVRKQLEIKELTEQVNGLKSFFRQQEESVTLTREGRPDLFVQVTPNARLDSSLAETYLDLETWRKVSKEVLDTALARRILSPEELAKITKTFEPKIEVKIK